MRLFFLFLLLFLIPSAHAHYSSANSGEYGTLLLMQYDPAPAGIETEVAFYLSNLSSGLPLTDLDIVHERQMHVFIVGEDLKTFAHIHPEEFPQEEVAGKHTVAYMFPGAGKYLIAADYSIGGRRLFPAFTEWSYGDQQMAPSLDYSSAGVFDGYTVSLEHPALQAGDEVVMTYHISKDGTGVTDLEQYLGSELHVFVVDANLTMADHTHAYVPGHGLHAGAMPQRYRGPSIPVKYAFSKPGTYVLFGQFQHGGKVTTTRFMVEVAPPRQIPYRLVAVLIGVLVLLLCIIKISGLGKK
jgi:hypothetical protein